MSIISRILTTPVPYVGFPQPIIYTSAYGHRRYKCPVEGCPYDGNGGFNQHYARKHAPEWWGWHNKQIEKVLTGGKCKALAAQRAKYKSNKEDL